MQQNIAYKHTQIITPSVTGKGTGFIASVPSIFAFFLFFSILSLIVLYKVSYYLNTETGDGVLIFWYIYSLFGGLFLLSRLPLAFLYDDKDIHAEGVLMNFKYPKVSFVIAGKDEEESIFKTIETCMKSDYPAEMECIAVDDGSTDKTYAEMCRASEFFGKDRVKAITLGINKGKREAMSGGVSVAKNEIIVFVDSDSFLKKDALRHLVHHFANPHVGAVSGNTGVANDQVNLLTKMQSIRYAVSYDIFKVSESFFGAVTCCPGCFSAYRRDAVLPVITEWRNQMFMGTRSTFGDDRSLTNFVLRTWDVEYCQTARAVTIVPEKYNKFLKQQLRWKKSWVREGSVAAKFIWRKHPLAAVAFYTNLILPTLGPVVIGLIIFKSIALMNPTFIIVFLFGVTAMGLLFGVFLFLTQKEKYWYLMPLFSIFYSIIMIWQMPYAIIRINDTKWGTR